MTVRPPLRSAGLALALLLGTAGSVAAMFHLRLAKSIPGKDERIGASPREIRLWFTEKPEMRLSSVSVQTSDSVRVGLGKVHSTDDPTSIAVDVTDSMPVGTYLVKWKTAGRDGHAIRGSFSFFIGK